MKRLLILVSLVFAGAFAMAAPQNNNNQAITVTTKESMVVKQQKPEFTITLKSNRTTGYSWFLKQYNPNLIKPISHKYIAPNTEKMGAPGYEQWTFKVLPDAFQVPMITKIKLLYIRPWEKTPAETKAFSIFTASTRRKVD